MISMYETIYKKRNLFFNFFYRFFSFFIDGCMMPRREIYAFLLKNFATKDLGKCLSNNFLLKFSVYSKDYYLIICCTRLAVFLIIYMNMDTSL